MHGKASWIEIKDDPIFENVPKRTKVARYHSLAGKKETLPDCLELLAKSDDGEVMAIRHQNGKVYGLQFHPESILSDDGMTILNNFIRGIAK